jgi:hypothetical protein
MHAPSESERTRGGKRGRSVAEENQIFSCWSFSSAFLSFVRSRPVMVTTGSSDELMRSS